MLLGFEARREDSGLLVGHLVLTPQPWTVLMVQTHPAYLRQGVASSLYRHASALLGGIEHGWRRSVHGDAWAKSVGGELPENSPCAMQHWVFSLWDQWVSANREDPQALALVRGYFPDAAPVESAPQQDGW